MAMYKGEAKIKDIYLGDVPIFKVYAGEEFCGFFTFSHENLISNSDLLIDSDSDGVPDGFLYYGGTTDISLSNGIAKFTVTARNGRFYCNYTALTAKYYVFARYKADSNLVRLRFSAGTFVSHSGSGNFEFISMVNDVSSGTSNIEINDYRNSDWTPIEVDYMGAINITDLVSRGILPSGLTDSQYKDILDNYFNS